MVSFLDYFVPNNNQLSPDQQNAAGTQGLLGAGAAMADLSAPHAGPQTTVMQLLTHGLAGYGQGAGGYVASLPAVNQALAANSSAQLQQSQNAIRQQLAQAYLVPGKGAGAVAGAMPMGGNPADPNGGMVGSAAPSPTAGGGAPAIPGQQPTLKDFYKGGAPATPANGVTASGLSVKGLAQQFYQQAQMSRAMGDDAGAAKLIEQAVAIDPTVNYSKAFATSQGQLPADLSKIGATGGEARKTATLEATLRPHDQQVMIDNKLYTIPSNDAAVAQGAIPTNVGAPAGARVSTLIPAGTKELADKQAQTTADTQDAAATLDSRVGNALQIIQQMKSIAPNTFEGKHGQFQDKVSDEGNFWQKGNIAQSTFEKLNSNLFTQELPGIIKGAGGRLDIPLLNSIKDASAVDPFAPHGTKLQNLQTLEDMLLKAQQNARTKATIQSGNTGGGAVYISPNGAASSTGGGWGARRVQ